MNVQLIWLWIVCLCSLGLNSAWAHQNSTAYLQLRIANNTIDAIYQLPLLDAAQLIDFDQNHDNKITWGEIEQQQRSWQNLLSKQLRVEDAYQTCQLQFPQSLMLNTYDDQIFLYQPLKMLCQHDPQSLNYQIMKQVDQNHRVILTFAENHSQIMAPSIIPLHPPTTAQMMGQYVQSGIHHLLIGMDHLLFLFCLLVPVIYHTRQQSTLKPLLFTMLAVASSFTLAHSITLCLAALQLLNLPTRWVETAIAASIIVAALSHLRPRPLYTQLLLAFVFGLIHGFGFANVLQALPLDRTLQILALLSFNVGIEIGQVLCIVLFFPVFFLCRKTSFFRYAIYPFGMLTAVFLSCLWMFERALG